MVNGHGSPAPGAPWRAALGPVVLGAAVWCAIGTLTVADATDASARLASPAPWWTFVIGAGVAALLGPVRRKPAAALPALLTTIPWWPVPMPAAGLIWTGPLAWLPVACAVAAACGGAVGPLVRRALRVSSPAILQRRLAALLTLVACGAALWSAGYRLRGDEPHYLMITQSLLGDGDLRIENNHDRREYADFYRDGRLVPDFTVRGADGEIYSIHAPGTPVFVLPAFALLGWRGAQLALLLLSAITGALVWHIGHRASGDAASAWFGWAATMLTPTFLLHSFAVFPDAPAAFVTAVATAVIVHLARGGTPVPTAAVVTAGTLLAVLPWLHSRLVVFACGLGAIIAWRLWRDAAEPSTVRARRVAAFAAIPVLSAIAWFGFFWVVYGAPDPRLPYGGDDEARPAWIPAAILGLLFDQQYGLFFHAPVLAAATALGFGRAARGTTRAANLQVLAAALLYLTAVTLFRMWWAGIPSAPARFLVALLPVLAAPAAAAWHHARAGSRALLAGLLALSTTVSALLLAVDRGALAWNQRDAQARFLEWLAPVVNLPRAMPSFFWAGEAAFVLHAVMIGAACAATWFIVQRTGDRRGWSPATWRFAVCLWLPLTMSVLTPVGWLVTRSSGLDPTRSQLAMARHAADAEPTFEIGAARIAGVSPVSPPLYIRTEQLDRWRAQVRSRSFRDVPAGIFDLQVSGEGASGETLTATVGDSPEPFGTFPPGSLSGGVSLVLSGGASALHFGSPNPDVDMTHWTFTLRPRSLWSGPPATRSARLGDLVLFIDDHVHVEPDGFWTAGASTARVGVANAEDRLALTLSNGPLANRVTVTSDAQRWAFDLAANEARPLDIVTTDGGVRLTVTSTAGFQPSQFSDSQDQRVLGVRITRR